MPTLRSILRSVSAASAPVILAPVVGEWFVKLAEEKGVYSEPSSRLGHAMTWLASWTNLRGFDFVAGLVVGLTIGLWLDYLLRVRERRKGTSRKTPRPAQDAVVPESITPEALGNLCRNHTAIEAERLAAPYVGKWIMAEGEIKNVTSLDGAVHALLSGTEFGTATLMYFDGPCAEQISLVSKGVRVKVVGRLVNASESIVTLEDCRLAT